MDEENKLILEMHDFNTKTALAAPLDFVMRNTNETPFNILPDPLSTTPVVIYFQKNSYLTKRFSDIIQNMMASGLIEFWIDNEKNTKSTMSAGKSEPKVITMKNLMAPFILCVAGLSISSVIFLLEKIYYRYGTKRQGRINRSKVLFNT